MLLIMLFKSPWGVARQLSNVVHMWDVGPSETLQDGYCYALSGRVDPQRPSSLDARSDLIRDGPA